MCISACVFLYRNRAYVCEVKKEEEEKDEGRGSVGDRIVSHNIEKMKAASSRCLKVHAKLNNHLYFRWIGVTGNV